MKDLFERLLLEMFNTFRRMIKLHLDKGDTLIINIQIDDVSLHREERVDKPLDVNELVVSGLLRELADALDNGDVKLIEGEFVGGNVGICNDIGDFHAR